jgi:uncharacterized membrane protein YfcA
MFDMMDSIVVLVLVGFLIGTFGTLIGAGGGFLLVPLLLMARPDMPPEIVTAISIAIVAANAISGSVAYHRAKRIDYKAGLVFAAYTIPGSIIGVYLTKYIPHQAFNITFGILLAVLAVYLLISNRKHASETPPVIGEKGRGWRTHALKDASGDSFIYSYNQNYGIIISIAVGFISPVLGIGGGIIHVPAMVQLLRFPLRIATATSHFILAIMATISVAVHAFNGVYNDPEVLKMVLALSAGVVPGAVTGAWLSHKIPTLTIIRIMAICLAVVGIRIIFQH